MLWRLVWLAFGMLDLRLFNKDVALVGLIIVRARAESYDRGEPCDGARVIFWHPA